MMQRAIACLAIDGTPVTGTIREALLKQKYKPRVAKHLGMKIKDFESVDWEGHARALGTERSPALMRVVWGHHPTKTHLKLTGQHPSDMCPLCGKIDRSEHFFQCKNLNQDKKYKTL